MCMLKLERGVGLLYAYMCSNSRGGWLGSVDRSAIFQQAGIPTVNIGPSGFGLHEPVEWVDLDSVVDTAAILFHAANSFFSRKLCDKLSCSTL